MRCSRITGIPPALRELELPEVATFIEGELS
jgi:hypothetical protein